MRNSTTPAPRPVAAVEREAGNGTAQATEQIATPSVAQNPELRTWAGAYHALGLLPIPIRQGRPRVSWRPFIDRFPTWEAIEALPWGEADGIGLVLGHPAPTGGFWWVLDIEAAHRPEAEAWLDAHVPGWRESLVAESQRGGLHVYAQSSEPAPTTRCAFGDIKARGGLVFAPPTRAFKPDAVGDYRWLSPLAGAPGELEAAAVKAVRLSPNAVPGVLRPGTTGPAPGEPLDVAAVLAGVPAGRRHDALFRLACKLRAADVPHAWADRLVAEAAAACSPPYPSGPGEEPVPRIVERVYNNYRPNPTPATDSTVLPPIGGGAAVTTHFRSPAELLAAAPERVPWVWQGFLARSALTVLGAREKAGKSTLMWALLAAVLRGEPFCDLPTARAAVVVLTEEAPTTVAEKLTRFGIAPDAPVSILTRTDVRGKPPWPDLVAAAVAEAERLGAHLLVVDTLAFWAGLPGDAENLAGAVTEALRPLIDATARGLAVLVLHHVAKATGELRGSTAIGATADIIVTLSREAESPSRRRLEAVGRFSDCPTEPLLVELTGDRYAALGSPREVTAAERERVVREALPTEPPGLTQRELVAATGLPQQRVAEALGALTVRGAVLTTGAGTKASPYRYWRLPDAAPDRTATTDGWVAPTAAALAALGGLDGVDALLPPGQGIGPVER